MQKISIISKRILLIAFFLACCAYVVLFCFKNSVVVDIDLLFVQLSAVKLEMALVASFVAGGLAGLLSSIPFLLGMRKKYQRNLGTRHN